MEPYFETKNGVLYKGDCVSILKDLTIKADIILTDPPYGIGVKSNHTKHQREISNDKLDEYQEHLPAWLQAMYDSITDTGCCCCCCAGGGKTPGAALFTIEAIKYFNLIQTVIWDKCTIGLGWRYRPSYETILILSKDKDNYNFYDTTKKCSNIVRYNNVIPQKGEHPTVKPIKLMHHFLKIHSKPGDLVLDPFFGSGTTGIACETLGRKWIGIELDEEYCSLAAKRIRQVTLNPVTEIDNGYEPQQKGMFTL